MTLQDEIKKLEIIRDEALRKASSFYKGTFRFHNSGLVNLMKTYKIATDQLKELDTEE